MHKTLKIYILKHDSQAFLDLFPVLQSARLIRLILDLFLSQIIVFVYVWAFS